MTRTTTKIDVHGITPQIVRRGPFAGHPALYITLGPGTDKTYTVQSILNQVESYNWRKRLEAPETLLVFDWMETGGGRSDPLHRKHVDGIVALMQVLGDTETLVKTPASRIPADHIERYVDHYYVEIPAEDLDDRLTTGNPGNPPVGYLAGISRDGSDTTAHFLHTVTAPIPEDDLNAFRSEYKVPKEHVWLVPAGDSPELVAPIASDAEMAAKRNRWNVSPRMDLVELMKE